MTNPNPMTLRGSDYFVFDGTVRVINICTLLDAMFPNWLAERDYEAQGKAMMAWCTENNVHYYAKDAEDFSCVGAAFEAEREGYRVVLVENLS